MLESVDNQAASENQLTEDIERLKKTIQELHDSIEDKESKVAEYTEKIVELTEDLKSQKVIHRVYLCALIS